MEVIPSPVRVVSVNTGSVDKQLQNSSNQSSALVQIPNYASIATNCFSENSIDVELDTESLYEETETQCQFDDTFGLKQYCSEQELNELIKKFIPIVNGNLGVRSQGYAELSKLFFNKLERDFPKLNQLVDKLTKKSTLLCKPNKKTDTVYTITGRYDDVEGMIKSVRELSKQTVDKRTTEGIFIINGPPDKSREIAEAKKKLEAEIKEHKGLNIAVLTMSVPEWRFGLKSISQLVALKRMQLAGRESDFVLQNLDADNEEIDEDLLEEHKKEILDYRKLFVCGSFVEKGNHIARISPLLEAENEIFNSLVDTLDVTKGDKEVMPALESSTMPLVAGANYALSAFALLISGPAKISKSFGEDTSLGRSVFEMAEKSGIEIKVAFAQSDKVVKCDDDRAIDTFNKKLPQFLKFVSNDKKDASNYSNKPEHKVIDKENYEMLLSSLFEAANIFLLNRDNHSKYSRYLTRGDGAPLFMTMESKLKEIYKPQNLNKDKEHAKWQRFVHSFLEFKFKKHVENLNKIKLFREKGLSFVLLSVENKERLDAHHLFEIALVDHENKKIISDDFPIACKYKHQRNQYDFKISNPRLKDYQLEIASPEEAELTLEERPKSKFIISKM